MAEKIQKIIEEISNLTVLELNELVKALEEKFGVQAVSFQAPAQAKVEEKTEAAGVVDIVLVESGPNKLNVIKVIREINPNLSLKDAKDIVDNPPQKVAEKVEKKKAEELKQKFESAGAKVELK
jgi:large subunit ribosomal protein L7/L12